MLGSGNVETYCCDSTEQGGEERATILLPKPVPHAAHLETVAGSETTAYYSFL